jgi:hypothetical protein
VSDAYICLTKNNSSLVVLNKGMETKSWSVSLHAMENTVQDFVVDITGFARKEIA